jgi:hypothetical protein
VYSSYLATESTNSILDGNLVLYGLSTGSSANLIGTSGTQNAVQNCVNPHFSSDGAKIVFAGIPESMVQSGTNQQAGTSLRIFVLDLARGTPPTQLTGTNARDEDASFSPNGQTIIFKRTLATGTTSGTAGQIWTMTADGSNQSQLTYTSDQKSGPNYSPDGSTIVYYSGAGQFATIWKVGASGSNATLLVSSSNIEKYYPIYSGSNDILYTSWVSASDTNDEICDYTINTATSQILTTNTVNALFGGANNSDPFPVGTTLSGTTLMGFSSTQYTGVYAPYLGIPLNGVVYSLPYLSSTLNDLGETYMPLSNLNELGGTYTPYSHSRELVIVSPTAGSTLVAGGTATITVTGWSDGGPWSEASPSVAFEGIGTTGAQYTLNDSGISNGAETYSATITLPQTTGSYTVIATGTSSDNRLSNIISSMPVAVSLITTKNDFNSDGHPDLLWQNVSNGNLAVWLMNGTSLLSEQSIGAEANTSWQIVGTGVFNGSGYNDLLWQNNSTGQIMVWFMNGTTYVSSQIIATAPDLDWKIVGTGDFKGDGQPDILWQNSSTGAVGVWLMNGATILSEQIIASQPNTAWKIVATGDFNGDGNTDILWQNTSTGTIAVWFMNGTTVASSAIIGTETNLNWTIVGAGDFNGDGATDILWQNSSTGSIGVWLMNGTTVLSESVIGANPNSSWRIRNK